MRGFLSAVLVLSLAFIVSCGKDSKDKKSSGEGANKETNEVANYAAKSKTTEAREFVKKMYDGARTYYMDPPMGGGSIGDIPRPQLPGPSVGPTPPLGACCKAGGKCAPAMSLWQEPTWVALYFSVDDPHYYSYAYKVDGNKFTAAAYGDLDCDGVYSTFEMSGEVAEGEMPGQAKLTVKDELE